MEKGTLYGKDSAVKTFAPTSLQGIEEFENEIRMIINAKHTSLVQILGGCVHG